MARSFTQKRISFNKENANEKLKVSKLLTLLEGHPYEEKLKKVFNTDVLIDDYISIGNISTVFNKLQSIQSQYKLYNIKVHTKDVAFTRGDVKIEGIPDSNPLAFKFAEYTDEFGEVFNEPLLGYSIYDSKSQFFDDFKMTKFVNMLFDKKYDKLAEYNLNFFRSLPKEEGFNKYRSYRLMENNGEKFVRGVTSLSYKEYGVGFSFVVSMLMLHKYMKREVGNNYSIIFTALNESKLEMIITSDYLKDAGDFGKIRSAISVKTNDYGKGALSITNIINVVVKGSGFYLYPKSNTIQKKNINIGHGNTPPQKALETLSKLDDFYGYVDGFVEELKSIKTIKSPEDLRKRILLKFEHHNSLLKAVKGSLAPIFSTILSNDIKDFASLLEMCRKAEELEIDYDLKEKLRIEISDIILNKK